VISCGLPGTRGALAPATEVSDPTHEDPREALSTELSKYPTRDELNARFDAFEVAIGARFEAMEEHLLARMLALLEPTSTHGPRLTQLEARTSVRGNARGAARRAPAEEDDETPATQDDEKVSRLYTQLPCPMLAS
jgi:hypothetical protein